MYTYNDELMHYGVLGMKWGKRKRQPLAISSTRSRYDQTKANYKAAKITYNQSFGKAYDKAAAAYSPFKKHRQANAARWEKVANDAERLNNAHMQYKQAKKDRSQAIKAKHSEINKQTSFGQKLLYNDATRKLAAKYVVDNNMSVKDATARAKSDANRNSVAFLAAYGAIAVAGTYAMKKFG